MGDDEALVFLKAVRAPIKAKCVRYYQETYFDGLFDDWRGSSVLAITHQPLAITHQQKLISHNADTSINVIPFPTEKQRVLRQTSGDDDELFRRQG